MSKVKFLKTVKLNWDEFNVPNNTKSPIAHRFVGVWSCRRRRIARYWSTTGHENRRLVNIWRTTGRKAHIGRNAEALTRRHKAPVTNQRHPSGLCDGFSGSYSFTGQAGRLAVPWLKPAPSSSVSWEARTQPWPNTLFFHNWTSSNCYIHTLKHASASLYGHHSTANKNHHFPQQNQHKLTLTTTPL